MKGMVTNLSGKNSGRKITLMETCWSAKKYAESVRACIRHAFVVTGGWQGICRWIQAGCKGYTFGMQKTEEVL